MFSITKHNDKAIQNNTREIVKLRKGLIQLIDHLQIQLGHINYTMRVLERRTRAIKLVSLFTSKLFTHLGTTINLYEDQISLTDMFLESITTLMQGEIPHKLIEPTRLLDILEHAEKVLYSIHPDYELSFHNLDSYYRLSNVGFTIVNNSLIIQLALPIRQKVQKLMDIFKIERVFVTWNVSESDKSKNHQYTLIDPQANYLCVEGNNFIQLTSDQFTS